MLVGGPEEYLGSRAMDRIRGQVREAAPDVEITRLNAGSYEPGSLAMNVSPSLFGERKLIEVEGLEAMNDAFLADALNYVAAPEPDAVLVLRHGGGVRGKKLLDAIKAGWLARCGLPAAQERCREDRLRRLLSSGLPAGASSATPSRPWSTRSAPTSPNSRRPAAS